jgi:hypothetical protein
MQMCDDVVERQESVDEFGRCSGARRLLQEKVDEDLSLNPEQFFSVSTVESRVA